MKVGIPHRSNMHNVGIPQNIPTKKFTGRKKQSANRKYGQVQGMIGIIAHTIRPRMLTIHEISINSTGPRIVKSPICVLPTVRPSDPKPIGNGASGGMKGDISAAWAVVIDVIADAQST